MTNQIQTVNFHNQTLITLEKDGNHYVAMKPICENIGLDWASQFTRIKRDEVLNSVIVMITTTGADRKIYKMLCLPIQYLNGWLFGVDTNRVKAQIKDKLITYKKNATKPYLIIGIMVWRSIHEQPKMNANHWCKR